MGETILMLLGLVGTLAFIAGWLWLVVIAFKEGGVGWGAFVLGTNLVGGIIFAALKKKAWMPLLMTICGFAVMLVTTVIRINIY